jgi:protein-tyrosine-phosphatase
MHELDLDISNQSSKKLTPDMVASADVVVDLTIGKTYEYLDAQPHLLYIPLPFTDPNKFRESAEDVRLPAYRKTRDELRELIGDLAEYCLTPET